MFDYSDWWACFLIIGALVVVIIGFAFLAIEFPGLLDCPCFYKNLGGEGDECLEESRLTGRRRVKSDIDPNQYHAVIKLSRQASRNMVRKISWRQSDSQDVELGEETARDRGFVRKISQRIRRISHRGEEEAERESNLVRKLSNTMRRTASGGQWMGRKSREGGIRKGGRRRLDQEEMRKMSITMEQEESGDRENTGSSYFLTECAGKGKVKIRKQEDNDNIEIETVHGRAKFLVRSLSRSSTSKEYRYTEEGSQIEVDINCISVGQGAREVMKQGSMKSLRKNNIEEVNKLLNRNNCDIRLNRNSNININIVEEKDNNKIEKPTTPNVARRISESFKQTTKKKKTKIKGVVIVAKSKRLGRDYIKRRASKDRRRSEIEIAVPTYEDNPKKRKVGLSELLPSLRTYGEEERAGYEGDAEGGGRDRAHMPDIVPHK